MLNTPVYLSYALETFENDTIQLHNNDGKFGGQGHIAK